MKKILKSRNQKQKMLKLTQAVLQEELAKHKNLFNNLLLENNKLSIQNDENEITINELRSKNILFENKLNSESNIEISFKKASLIPNILSLEFKKYKEESEEIITKLKSENEELQSSNKEKQSYIFSLQKSLKEIEKYYQSKFISNFGGKQVVDK